MKNAVRIAAAAAAVCWIFAFASCSQPASKDSGGNNSGYQQGGGQNGGNNSQQGGGNGSNYGGGNQNGGNGNGSNQGGGNQNGGNGSNQNGGNKTNYAVTFWYVENVNDENDDYTSSTLIEPGETGYITGITGGKTYKLRARLTNGSIRYYDSFYLNDNETFSIDSSTK